MVEYLIRKILQEEYGVLEDFLYEAIFIPKGVPAPPRSILKAPELQVYTAGFGKKKDDLGIVAEVDKKIIGAVWTRIMQDYGHIDEKTPSFAIALYKEYRNLGIGTAMMKEMLRLLKQQGYKRASLAVQKANAAVRMYQRAGFEIIQEKDEEYIMVYELL